VHADHLAVLVDEHHRGFGHRLDAVLVGVVAGTDGLVDGTVVAIGDDQVLVGRGVEQQLARPFAGLAVAVGGVEQAQRRDPALARGHRRHDRDVALARVDHRLPEAVGQLVQQVDVAGLALGGDDAFFLGQVTVVVRVGDQHDATVGVLGDFKDFLLHGLSLQ